MWTQVQEVVQVLASLATAIALVALLYQLLLLNRQLRIDAHAAVVANDRALWTIALEHPSVAPALMQERWQTTGHFEPSEELFAALLLDHFEHIYVRYRNGFVDGQQWKALQDYVVDTLRTEPVRAVWESNKRLYLTAFTEHFDDLIDRPSEA